ncbi:hypothetical protein ANN_21924 [Periplaneta americana]|uniref:Reverse transcriptase domain-containing protein n=1 Tax=Periplaneta americana TaxID=6978 RepID=A0ABQ8S7K5_PERAM|nr:hypothetical protein ANN_21924 [Periplaneta americana]
MGFRKGRSCNDNIFSIKRILEKRREVNLETHIAFVDFDKAFDCVERSILWKIMYTKGYPPHLIEIIKCLYADTKIIINTGTSKTEEIRINQGFRQGCSLSPSLFNIYLDDLIKEWKMEVNPGIKISKDTFLNVLMFADDVILIQDSEEKLQYAIHKLHLLGKEDYNLSISTHKTKVMAHSGKFTIRTKIIVDNKPIEQVSHFDYLGCNITYDVDRDIDNKISKFQWICGTINRTLKNKTRKETKLKFYKTMAVPVLTYGSESWIIKERDKSKLQTAEMRCLRRVKGCTRRDLIRNEDIRKELNIYNRNDKVEDYKEKWKEHLSRMDNERIPALIQQYQPKGKRDVGRPRKRIGEEISEGSEIGRGVRQECPLSSTLFNIYLEDLVNNCFQNMGGVIVRGRRIKCIIFADGMTFLAEEEMIRMVMLLELNNSCEQYGMKINGNKTKTMVIGGKIKKNDAETDEEKEKELVGHWLRRNCLLKDALEGKVNGRRVRGRRRYQKPDISKDDVNMLGENPQTIRENTGILLEASKEIDKPPKKKKTKYRYMIMSRDQNIVRKRNIEIGNLSFKKVKKFKYLGVTATHINKSFRAEVVRLRWAGHVARIDESRNAYRVLVGRPQGKIYLGRRRRRWEDNIEMDLREVRYNGRDWINLSQDRNRWWAENGSDEEYGQEYKRRRPRWLKERATYFQDYDDSDFVTHFRLSKTSALSVLSVVEHCLEFTTNRNDDDCNQVEVGNAMKTKMKKLITVKLKKKRIGLRGILCGETVFISRKKCLSMLVSVAHHEVLECIKTLNDVTPRSVRSSEKHYRHNIRAVAYVFSLNWNKPFCKCRSARLNGPTVKKP